MHHMNTPWLTQIKFEQSVPTDASQSVHSTKTNPVFPLELFEHITARLIIFSPPQDATNGSLCSQKSSWSDVSGFMAASVLLHNIAMARWMRVLTIRSSEDWEKVLKQPHLVRYVSWFVSLMPAHSTRSSDLSELTCLDCVIGSGIGQSILTRFPNLHTVSINAHSDVYRNQSGRFSYRDVFNSLPASLLRLEVTCAHGPDLKVIETVRRYCPNIETLRLGRCTMFNRTPACEFWSGFPFDHDAYIAADGTDDYAVCFSFICRSAFDIWHLSLALRRSGSLLVEMPRKLETRRLSSSFHHSSCPPRISHSKAARSSGNRLAAGTRGSEQL